MPVLIVKMAKFWTLTVLCTVLLTAAFVDCDSSADAAIANSKECAAVHAHFVKHKIGHHTIIPEKKVHDENMEICYKGSAEPNRKSCCTHHMEKKYSHAAEKHFNEVMESTSLYLEKLFENNAKQYQEKVMNLLSLAENHIHLLFSQIYKLSPREHHGPVADLFMDLRSHVKNEEVNIHETVNSFFDKLFPHVFQNILKDPKSTDRLTDYKECLIEIRQRIQPRPFGDYPHKLSSELTRSMGVSRLLMEALTLGKETINTTYHLTMDSECIHALTRLKYCSHCEGRVGARPCHGFCLNVIRGCLASVAELDSHWKDFVEALEALVENMKGSLNVEQVLQGMHSRVNDAVLHAMDTAPKFHAQVITQCGYANKKKTEKASPKEEKKKGVTDLMSTIESLEQVKLSRKVELLVRSLVASKGFYHSLADTMCSADMYASRAGHACWNGSALALYNRSVTDIGLTQQLSHNPEMQITHGSNKVLVSLMDKLIHMKKLLASKVTGEQMQADSFQRGRTYYYGSGQGDDEDDGGSGSGSGMNPDDQKGPHKVGSNPDHASPGDIYYESTHNNGNSDSRGGFVKKSSRSSASTSSVIVVFTSILLTAFWLSG